MRQGEDPKDCWCTPSELARNLIEEFGCTWDAACEAHNCLFPEQADVIRALDRLRLMGVESYFPWNGLLSLRERTDCAFVNPPYSNIGPWVEAAIWRAEHLDARTVMLLPSNRMGRKWVEAAINSGHLLELSFFCGRIRFVPPEGVEESSPRFDNMLLVFRRDPAVRLVFSRDPKTGAILRKKAA